MDPNNTQPVETNPAAQTGSSSMPPTEANVPAPTSVPTPTPLPTPVPENVRPIPKGKSSKVIILLIILILLAIGMTVYILFVKNQMSKTQKSTINNASVVIPTPTLLPTLAPKEDLEVSSPEADLLELDADAKGL